MKRPWFRFFPSDWLNGTRGLSLEERGAYMTLLALMYDQQGAIPDAERWVCGALDCDVRVWRRLRDKLCRCGKISPNTDGFLVNRRVLEEVTSAELVAEVRRKSGRSGGKQSGISRALSLKNKDNPEAFASNLPLYARGRHIHQLLSSDANASSESGPKLVFSKPESKPDEIREAVEAWNETARRQGWTGVVKLTPARRQMIAARLREHGPEVWRAMLRRAAALAWINDPSKRATAHANWTPHIDWFAKASTFLKLFEGAYGSNEPAAAETKRRQDLFDFDGTWRDEWGPPPAVKGGERT